MFQNDGKEEDRILTPEYIALMDETFSFYKRAMAANPRDPVTVADLGRFLLVVMKKVQKSERRN